MPTQDIGVIGSVIILAFYSNICKVEDIPNLIDANEYMNFCDFLVTLNEILVKL